MNGNTPSRIQKEGKIERGIRKIRNFCTERVAFLFSSLSLSLELLAAIFSLLDSFDFLQNLLKLVEKDVGVIRLEHQGWSYTQR